MRSDNPYIPHVSIQPNLLAFYHQRQFPTSFDKGGEPTSSRPKNNCPSRDLAASASKKIKRAVNWMLELAQEKKIYHEKKGVYFRFKLNFITLTLPTLQMHLDTTIKNKCLNNFLTELRKYQNVHNYVWRAEVQKNGSIHFHIITDTYINLYVLRKIWNRQLRILGYIDRYSNKFKGLSFMEYCQIVDPSNNICLSIKKKRFDYGNKTNWQDPNTTDIHSLSNVKNPAAYIAKYLTKSAGDMEEDGRYNLQQRKIKGRKYGVSRKLGKLKGYIDLVDSKTEELVSYVIDQKRAKIIESDWFSIVLTSFNDWNKRFSNLYKKILKEMIASVNYLVGGYAKNSYILR